jgi:predicted RNA binding protein YcfA (HicA-like mRNA interferase family)
MGRLRPVKSEAIIKILTKYYGYNLTRIRGRHAHLEDKNGHYTTVLLNEELRQSLIKLILRDTCLEWGDIEKYL